DPRTSGLRSARRAMPGDPLARAAHRASTPGSSSRRPRRGILTPACRMVRRVSKRTKHLPVRPAVHSRSVVSATTRRKHRAARRRPLARFESHSYGSRMAKTRATFAAGGLVAVLAACSNTERGNSDVKDAAAKDAAGSMPDERPAGPAADVSEEITGGNGPFIGAASGLTPP